VREEVSGKEGEEEGGKGGKVRSVCRYRLASGSSDANLVLSSQSKDTCVLGHFPQKLQPLIRSVLGSGLGFERARWRRAHHREQ
jgi:hypothetical protein